MITRKTVESMVIDHGRKQATRKVSDAATKAKAIAEYKKAAAAALAAREAAIAARV